MTTIKVLVGSNLKRETKLVKDTDTLRSVLEGAGVNYSTSPVTLDGATLNPGDLDKTFADFGIKESCYLFSVKKADNA